MNPILLSFAYGIIGLLIYRYKNPFHKFLTIILIFVFGLFLSQLLFVYLDELTGQIAWTLSAVGLTIFYLKRFASKPDKTNIDVVKILGLVMLIIYPLPFASIFNIENSSTWIVLNSLTISILGTILIYDRWILKPSTMKKKFVTILVIQSIIIFFLLIYAFIQKTNVDMQLEYSRQQEHQLIELQKQIDELENAR